MHKLLAVLHSADGVRSEVDAGLCKSLVRHRACGCMHVQQQSVSKLIKDGGVCECMADCMQPDRVIDHQQSVHALCNQGGMHIGRRGQDVHWWIIQDAKAVLVGCPACSKL